MTDKFKGVFDARKKRDAPPTLVEVLGSGPAPTELEAKESRAKGILRAADRAPADRKRGGRRSDPDYEPITVFVRKETYRKVKIALLEDERNKQAGDLIEELLSKWIDERQI